MSRCPPFRAALVLALLSLAGPGCGWLDSASESDADTTAAGEGKGAKGRPGGGPEGPKRVNAAYAEAKPLESTIAVTGEVIARRVVDVSAVEAGRVDELLVDEGDAVDEGAVLARLDDELQSRAIAEARRRVDVAKARKRSAAAQKSATKRDIARRKPLAASEAFPKAELARIEDTLDVQSATLKVSQSEVAQAKAELTTAQAALSRRQIDAPFAGLVSVRHIAKGAVVSAATPIVTLVDRQSLRFVAPVAEPRLADVTPGAIARLRLDALGTEVFGAVVQRIGDTVNREARTVDLELGFDSPPAGLRHGMFGRGELVVGRAEGGVVLPSKALVREADGAFVWRVDDGTATKVAVEVQLEADGLVAVAGVPTGALVAISGQRGLSDGDEVAARAQGEAPEPKAAKAEATPGKAKTSPQRSTP